MSTSALPSGPLLAPVLVNVREAKTHLSRLSQQVEAGQEVVIAPPGVLAGAISVSDDFNAPLDDLFVSNLFPIHGARGTSAARHPSGAVVAERRSTPPSSVVSLLQEAGQEVFVSQASLWDMAIKTSLGRLSADLAQVERSIPEQGFRWLSLRNEHPLAPYGPTVRLV